MMVFRNLAICPMCDDSAVRVTYRRDEDKLELDCGTCGYIGTQATVKNGGPPIRRRPLTITRNKQIDGPLGKPSDLISRPPQTFFEVPDQVDECPDHRDPPIVRLFGGLRMMH